MEDKAITANNIKDYFSITKNDDKEEFSYDKVVSFLIGKALSLNNDLIGIDIQSPSDSGIDGEEDGVVASITIVPKKSDRVEDGFKLDGNGILNHGGKEIFNVPIERTKIEVKEVGDIMVALNEHSNIKMKDVQSKEEWDRIKDKISLAREEVGKWLKKNGFYGELSVMGDKFKVDDKYTELGEKILDAVGMGDIEKLESFERLTPEPVKVKSVGRSR